MAVDEHVTVFSLRIAKQDLADFRKVASANHRTMADELRHRIATAVEEHERETKAAA